MKHTLAALLTAFLCICPMPSLGAEQSPYVFKTPRPDWLGAHSRFAVVDKTGTLLFRGDPQHELADTEFKQGFLKIREGNKLGLLDATGKIVLLPRFEDIELMSGFLWDADQFAWVALDKSKDTWTCVNRSGVELIPAKDKHTVLCPSEGVAIVYGPTNPATKTSSSGLVDRKGNFVIEMGRFEQFGALIAGRMPAKQGGRWGLIDKSGTFLIAATFDDMDWSYTSNLLRVSRDRKWGFIDHAGKVVIPLAFEDIGQEGFFEGRLRAKRDGKWGYLDQSGKFAIEPVYDAAKRFRNGIAEVKVGKHSGFIDPAGKVVIPIENSEVQNEGALVKVGNRLYDTKGKRIPMPALERTGGERASWTLDPSGVILFQRMRDIVDGDDRFGIADSKGRVLAAPAFLNIYTKPSPWKFQDGMLPAQRAQFFGPFLWRMEMGLLATSGQFVTAPALGGVFGPYYGAPEGESLKDAVKAIGAVPGAFGMLTIGNNNSTTWYRVALTIFVFPLLFGIWWVSAWRVALRHVACVEVAYGRAWRGMILWIMLAAAWYVVLIWNAQTWKDLEVGDIVRIPLFVALFFGLPLLPGIVMAHVHARQPGRALKRWVAGLLTFLAFVLLSGAPFALAWAGVDWYETYWPLAVLAALFGLSLAVRKRGASAASSLRELAFAGFASWGVVLLWLRGTSFLYQKMYI